MRQGPDVKGELANGGIGEARGFLAELSIVTRWPG
jgi:hypothetical protein